MKLLPFLIILLLCSINSIAQDYERVDASIQLYPERFEDVSELSAMISRDFNTDEDKLRAIYSWIIHNVAYDPEEYKKFNYSFKNYRERNAKEEKTRGQIIKRTLQNGVAVCEGYAMLFEKLCNLQGIANYLVRGDIKTNFDDIGRPFRKIHMWNVAFLDDKPYLFDPTWGAGKYRGRFIKEPTYFYFKTPPELFVKTHFPDLEEDTLLSEMIGREVFASWPLVILEELSLDAVEAPYHGIIDSQQTLGKIEFSVRVNREIRVSFTYGNDKVPLDVSSENGLLKFSVPFELGQENLLIYFDDKPALAYKIR